MLDSEIDQLWYWETPESLLRKRYDELVATLATMGYSPDTYNLIRSTLDKTFYTHKGNCVVDDVLPYSLIEIEPSPTSVYLYNDKTGPYGTLFSEKVSESLEDVEDVDEEFQTEVEHGVVYQRTNAGSTIHWKSRGNMDGSNFTKNEVTKSIKAILRNMGLAKSVQDEMFSEALVYYAEYLVKHERIKAWFPWKCERKPNYIAKSAVNKTIDKFRYDSRLKRKEADMTYVADYDTVPHEWVQKEHDNFDEEFSQFSLTQKKALLEFVKWNDTAPEGEKPPKALRQRIQRVPKLEYTEHVTTFKQPETRVRGLRESYPDEFPVTVTKVSPVTPELRTQHAGEWSRASSSLTLDEYIEEVIELEGLSW